MQGITRKQVNEAVSYQDAIKAIDAKNDAEAAEKALTPEARNAHLAKVAAGV